MTNSYLVGACSARSAGLAPRQPLVQFLPNGECRIAADHDRVGLVPMLTALRLSFPEVGYQKVRWFMARVF